MKIPLYKYNPVPSVYVDIQVNFVMTCEKIDYKYTLLVITSVREIPVIEFFFSYCFN